MFTRRVIGRVIIPAAALLNEKKELKCRPSELPIYAPEPTKDQKRTLVDERTPPTVVEQQIGNIRRQIYATAKEITTLQEKVEEVYNQAYTQTEWLLKYLAEEDNTTPKYGAIAIGGLAGFILALRGGKFRKLIFTSAGALGMAAICYPKEAAEYSHIFKQEAKRYLQIAYNFYHGVKKDDPPIELPSLPKFPTSLTEVTSMFSTTKQSDSVPDNIDEGKKPKAATVKE